MWSSWLFILLLSLPTGAQEAQSSLKLDEAKPSEDSSSRPYDLHFELDVRAQRDQRSRPANRSQESLHEIAVGGRYRFDRHVAVELELAMEQMEGESNFIAKEAFIDWTPYPTLVRARIGQQFLPVGLINERDLWFSSNPPFLRRLFAESKGIDLGALLDVSPLQNELVYLQGGIFSGRFVRAEDQRRESPESAPRVVSLKSKSRFHDAFATYFEHDLAVYDPVKAWGAGFEVRSGEWKGIQANALAEYWRIDQLQSAGPNQETQAYILHGEVSWWRLGAGYRYSVARNEMVSGLGRDRLADEVSKLTHFDIKLAEVFSLRAERVIETQDQTLRDEWVGRALLNWRL